MSKIIHNNELSLQKIIVLSVIWWVILFVAGSIALVTIPFTNTFSNYALEQQSSLPSWITRWSNFDGGAYLIISDVGYKQVGLLQAYFPTYPLLIKGVSTVTTFFFALTSTTLLNTRFVAGLGINFICFVLFLYYLNRYLIPRFSLSERQHIILAMLFFPTFFFLHAIYTEALFLLLLTLCLYCYQQHWWTRLTVFLVILTATRIVGVLLIPALMLDLYLVQDQTKSTKVATVLKFFSKHLVQLIAISIGTLGLFMYMVYLFSAFNDPLYFFHVQSAFGAGRQQNPVLFLQVVWRYIKIFWTARPIDWKYFAYLQEFIATMVVLVLLVLGVVRSRQFKLFFVEIAFSFGAFFLPTLTGNFSSMPRYVLVCLPIFFIFGQFLSRHKTAKIVYIVVCSILSFINIMLFIQGHWVA